jgi:hypothetical protein
MDHTFECFWGLKAFADRKFQGWNEIWHSVVFLNDGYSLHPSISLVSNIGHDGSGTNCTLDLSFEKNELTDEDIIVYKISLEENEAIRLHYINLHSFKYRLIFIIKYYARYLVRY